MSIVEPLLRWLGIAASYYLAPIVGRLLVSLALGNLVLPDWPPFVPSVAFEW